MEYSADSTRQPDVPRGTITKHGWQSQVFAGTTRDYWIYAPAGHDPQTPAGLMIFQDGHTYIDEEWVFRVPIVFDNLTYQKRLAPLIGLFINPGHKGSAPPANPWQSDNRSYEYDSLSDEYAQFLAKVMH